MTDINPEILSWARETAGLSLEEAARAIQLGDKKGLPGPDRLEMIEKGYERPSRRLLREMSQKYHRSLLVFYLDAPPPKGDRGQDFRTLPGDQPVSEEAKVDALIRDVKIRQNIVKDLLIDEEVKPLPLIGSANMKMGVQELSRRIARQIGFHLPTFRSRRTVGDAFSYLRNQVENCGIYVLLLGDLGSHHTEISVESFRGLALADPIAPFIVINDHDAKSAWSFTALHELAHIGFGSTGVSGAMAENRIERICNDVASEILFPGPDIQNFKYLISVPVSDLAAQVSEIAIERKLSRQMAAYALHRHGCIEENSWRAIHERYIEEWLEIKGRKSKISRADDSGPSYYAVRRHRLGNALLSLVRRSLGEGALTPSKAGIVLGVKARNVAPLLDNRANHG